MTICYHVEIFGQLSLIIAGKGPASGQVTTMYVQVVGAFRTVRSQGMDTGQRLNLTGSLVGNQTIGLLFSHGLSLSC